MEASGELLVPPRRGPGGLRGQILETFSISYGSRGGPGAEGTAVLGGNDTVLGPGGEDYRRGEQHLGQLSTSGTVDSRLGAPVEQLTADWRSQWSRLQKSGGQWTPRNPLSLAPPGGGPADK